MVLNVGLPQLYCGERHPRNTRGNVLENCPPTVGFVHKNGNKKPSRDVIDGRAIHSQILENWKSLGDEGDRGNKGPPHHVMLSFCCFCSRDCRASPIKLGDGSLLRAQETPPKNCPSSASKQQDPYESQRGCNRTLANILCIPLTDVCCAWCGAQARLTHLVDARFSILTAKFLIPVRKTFSRTAPQPLLSPPCPSFITPPSSHCRGIPLPHDTGVSLRIFYCLCSIIHISNRLFGGVGRGGGAKFSEQDFG